MTAPLPSGPFFLDAALDVASGQVIADLSPCHRAQEFIKFLRLIDREVPKDLEVHVVVDNSSAHKTPAVKDWLLAHPRFVFHFTPTYSSWMNLDDVEFATLEWVDWFNHRRLFETIGHIPPAELEDMNCRAEVSAEEAGLKQLSLH